MLQPKMSLQPVIRAELSQIPPPTEHLRISFGKHNTNRPFLQLLTFRYHILNVEKSSTATENSRTTIIVGLFVLKQCKDS
jgi:hypothetical protein